MLLLFLERLRCSVLGSQDPEKFKSRMHSLAYGNAMLAAVRDYKQVPSSDCSRHAAGTHLASQALLHLEVLHNLSEHASQSYDPHKSSMKGSQHYRIWSIRTQPIGNNSMSGTLT